MITKELISLELSGEAFSPAEARRLTGLDFARAIEPGEMGKKGRYEGVPVPLGQASIEVPEEIPAGDRLSWLLDTVRPHMGQLRRLGATQAYVAAGYFWRDQCNLAFSQAELARLAELGVELCLSCYEDGLRGARS